MDKKELINDTTTLSNRATQNVVTENPATISAVSHTKKALIMNVNSPKVTKLIGSVRNTSIGLAKAFNTPKTIATTMAVIQLSTLTPGIMYAATSIATVEMKILSNSFMT